MPGGSEALIPEVIGARCVHTLFPQATCRSCVDTCPTDAWVIDDECLGIDTTRCDGCGLCAAVCPQGAILSPSGPVQYGTEGGGIAFAACAGAGVTEPREGVLPCLHALSVRDLLGLARQGVHRLMLSRGDCATCPRGRGLPKERRLEQRLEGVLALLLDRGLTPLETKSLSPSGWESEHRAARARRSSPVMGRRAFFRGILKTAVDAGLELVESEAPRAGIFVPPGRMIPRPDSSHLALHAPMIDGHRCTGCDACGRLCPQGVIGVEAEAYRLDPDGCTGCGLCADLCEAVSIQPLEAAPQRRLALYRHPCTACGLDFHTPNPVGGDRVLCPICARSNHHQRLYQVLD